MKEILITSSVLILALLVLRLVFGKKVRRSLIYGAWALVALRLLVPVQIGQLNFSVLTVAEPLTETVTEVSGLRVVGQNEQDAHKQVIGEYIEKDQTVFTPEVQEQIQSAIQDDMPREEIAGMIDKIYSEQEIFVPEAQEQVQQQVAEQTNFVSLGQIATVVWLSGVAVMAVWFAVVNLRHSRMLRKNREKLDCQSLIPVYVSEKVGSPCLVGLFRPAIYLTPESAADEQILRHVLTHELTHYAHKDHIWSLVRCICLCVYWFNPLVWASAWFSRRDCELACDEGALQRLGEQERIAYGKSLLEVVSHAAAHGNLLQTATAMNETKKQLKERVNFIVKRPKLSIIAAVCMVLVCAIVAGCAAAGPVKDGNELLSATCETEKGTYQRGETVTVTVCVTNHGPAIDYVGAEVDQFSQAELYKGAGEDEYRFASVWLGVATDDATERVWKSGESMTYRYTFEIPQDAPLGAYSLSFWVCGKKVEIESVIKIVAYSWEVSEEVQAQLKRNYVEYMSFTNHSCTANDVNLVVISQVDSGYAMVIGCKCSSVDLNASWEELFGESTGDLMFYKPNGWHIQFCKDGDFRSLSEAYNLSWINYEQLRTIWDDYHAQFPKALVMWQSVNGDLTKPPERDSSGLDYEVNADGVTCTITGMGVCNDADVVIPEYIDGYRVTAIGKTAFWSKIRITSIVMPDSVVSIGQSAFEDCEQLKQITLSASLERISTHAFRGCKNLENIHLPDGLTSIGGGAFSGCSGLTEMTIPDGVTVIANGMLSYCKNLRYLSISGEVTDIEEGAFGGCGNLTQITYRGTMAQWESVKKANPWYTYDVEWVVICSDGQIVEKEG